MPPILAIAKPTGISNILYQTFSVYDKKKPIENKPKPIENKH